jgi:AcrR family transcriptional regulator
MLLSNGKPDCRGKTMSEYRTHLQTRLRLIDAAGAVFAEKGFKAASIRDICRLAGANIAAVNYHCGCKKSLYKSVLRHAQRSAIKKYPLGGDISPRISPRKQLAAFVEMLLRYLLEGGAWYGKLMIREIACPTPGLEDVVRKFFSRTYEASKRILRPMLGAVDRQTLDLCAKSLLAQCIFYRQSDQVLRMMNQSPPSTLQGIRDLARHITAFSLGGLENSAVGPAMRFHEPPACGRKASRRSS